MARRKLTDEEKAAREWARIEKRAAVNERIDANRAFHRSRQEARRRWWDKILKQRAKAAKKAAKKAARGPRQPAITVRPHDVSKHGTLIDSSWGEAIVHGRRVVGNREYRRAAGQRGKVRKPRRREMPAAVERRVERSRARWFA